MAEFPKKLEQGLQKRKEDNSFRSLVPQQEGIDFFSNDYLGFSTLELLKKQTEKNLKNHFKLGSTGSRLLSGNHPLFEKAETYLANFHNSEAALIFNSGYDANIGFFSAVPQKGDFIFYDEFSHASIRDGLKMSLARNYKFRHNDFQDLEEKLIRYSQSKSADSEFYVVTESVFSMDGDSPELDKLIKLKKKYGLQLIVDEAHATGVIGRNGEGMVQEKKLEDHIFARIHTFGKALGCHGAVILGSQKLIDYLVNFSRSFIYTTALSPHSVATIMGAYQNLKNSEAIIKLQENIHFFRREIKKNELQQDFIESNSAIQSCIIPGNERVKIISKKLNQNRFLVKPILSPTVPEGSERLRFCVHSYNSTAEITAVLSQLATFVPKD
ncbi:pyridoxal phosphate-dependent aminotransferase family protein [Gramella sp. AN32]|uniref:Aminotransferase class I/II-fold pyridoxal phosphate-dependent enzyme n=1 Tax=Christiangramia antarctica TaxID=2058158 RepID=A0ABW5X375_9FLAO|nr:pyridoxal phosphate-dependent aminotransferase family protein [Gramella sp. AN32]MCM4155234.1 8-amino-7-oxononanoate synthase [Gramella sp. AN32]